MEEQHNPNVKVHSAKNQHLNSGQNEQIHFSPQLQPATNSQINSVSNMKNYNKFGGVINSNQNIAGQNGFMGPGQGITSSPAPHFQNKASSFRQVNANSQQPQLGQMDSTNQVFVGMKGINNMPAPVIGTANMAGTNAYVQGMQNGNMTDKRGNQQRFNEEDNQDEEKNTKRGQQNEDQYFKKQMEFKGGKRHQLITDQLYNSNKIYANRYQGMLGVWYFVIDCVYHFENFLALVLFVLIILSGQYSQISATFPVVQFTMNVSLMAIRNCTFELRQRKITNKINNKMLEYLMITVKFKRFMPITWADIKPGYIIKVRSGQEFPADSLILDIQGSNGSTAQKCYVTSGPFDDATGIIQKRSYVGTTNKTGSKQNANHFAEMISGLLKFEYNYFGYIMGSFKLNENPASIEFDHDNVVQRGALLTHSPEVICLVLNVGDQCMGSVYKDPKNSLDSQTNQKLKSFVKTQRSFDKAYKQSIRLILIGLSIVFMSITALGVYLSSNPNFFSVSKFEELIVEGNLDDNKKVNTTLYLLKGAGFYSILLSSIPLSFSNIIDLLVLMSTNFAEWDVNVTPAKINFIYPHATLAFGKVAHMFFSRVAVQRDDKQSVKIFYIGGHFFKNQVSNLQYDQQMAEKTSDSYGDNDGTNQSRNETNNDDLSLEYLPNELIYTNKFYNYEAELILEGDNNSNKKMLVEFFRGITLCHQANVTKDKFNVSANQEYKYIGVLNDEIATLEFCQQLNFKLIQRKRKMMTIILQGNQERYDELGVVTTKALMGHFMTICAVRIQGQQAGVLYMKGSIATLKQYFVDRERDFEYLNLFESKFIQSGVQSIVYAKRQLTIEETNRLIITINEGIQSTKENNKLDNLLYNLSSVQLDVLGILGLQKAVHLRNRITIDEMVLNGVKPWIISKEDEQSHLTALNSLRIFQGCAQPLVINASTERVVMEQIQNALKTVTERMEQKSQTQLEADEQDDVSNIFRDDAAKTDENNTTDVNQGLRNKQNQRKKNIANKVKKLIMHEKLEKNDHEKQVKDQLQNSRNIVVFTGRALQEIMRDQTMIKSFVTLAYISNIMVGSEITPLQKQHLLKMVRQFIGEGEYAAAIVTTPEDQFMINEADLCVNLKSKGKSADFEAVVDVTLRDFSAISYLLFKHGNHIQMRLSKAAQAFFYRSLISFLVLTTYMIRSGFSGAIPYTEVYYFAFMIFLAPCEILIYAIFYKDYGYDQFYRIYGHYKYNFSFTLVELDYVVVDYMSAFFDWLIIYFPFEHRDVERMVSIRDGKNISKEAYNCYQVILMQIIFFQYLRNTNIHIMYAQTLLLILTIIGIAMIFDDDGLVGTIQLFTCPKLLFILLFQALALELRNQVSSLLSKLVIRRYADLLDWYADIEERLAYEEYEDIDQTFSIHQFKPIYQKINSSNIQRTLTLINTNMMKIPKTDGLEQILENINTELDNDRRGQVATGTINKWNLQLNDMNKETEYQDNKNQREIIYVKRQLIVFIATTLIFSLFGLTLFLTINFTNVGIFYYLGLSGFSFVMYQLLPRLYAYLSRTLLFYTVIVIFCYTIYTSGSESLQPAGLIFVLALVAGLNHSYIFPTITMIMGSVAMFNFFSFLAEDEGIVNSGLIQFNRTFVWFFTGIVWSAYVYMQELEKKTQFINGHRRVRNFAKLKKILDILVPSLVRDKMRQGTKNFADVETEITMIYFDLYAFDNIVKTCTTKELLNLLDQVYNVFDQLCDQYGLQKIETVGKTYMACGGLKSAERKIDSRLLNRHHSVRVTDFAIECSNYAKTIILKSGKNLEIQIAIHTGPVISGVVGETKPQFSLIGDTCTKCQNICRYAEPQKVTVSKETLKYLEIYTNNLQFKRVQLNTQDIQEQLYEVSVLRGRMRKNDFQKGGMTGPGSEDQKEQNQQDIQMSYLRTGAMKNMPDIGLHQYDDDNEGENEIHNAVEQASFNSERSGYESGNDDVKNHRQYIDEREYNDFENESNKSGLIDDGTMNLFGFNDDLNLDDKVIVQNATENNIYQVVERPKYLLQFEQKDLEQDFLFQISKQEANRTTMYLVLLIILNKIIILGDQLLDGKFTYTPQFILMFPVFILELTLCYKLLNPVYDQIMIWTGILHLYGVIVLGILLSLQVKYLGKWTQAGFNELQIQLTITLLFFMRNVLLRHFIVTYTIYMLSWIFTVTVLSKGFSYQIIQFIIGQIMYAILLGVGIHHREMIQRKSMNYERILNVEINKTNDLISKLVPFHMLSVIKSEKRQVDEFDSNLTVLFADISGFQQLNKSFKDPRESVIMLSKIFSRFDQLCDENRVYKIYTYGSNYVVMGYNGRLDKSKRIQGVVLDEANKVIQTGLDMIDTIQEFKEQMSSDLGKYLNIKVGIHTGKVVAGIIGSKVVRYDIFGEGVVVGNKILQMSQPGNVLISDETKRLIISQPDVAREYTFEEYKRVDCKQINRSTMSYIIKKNEELSNRDKTDSYDSYGEELIDDQSQSSQKSNSVNASHNNTQSKDSSRTDRESIEHEGLLKKSRRGGFSVDKSNNDSD